MCLLCFVAYGVGGIGMLLGSSGAPLALATTSSPQTISSQVQNLQELPLVLGAVKAPSLEEPAWLKAQNAAEAAAKAAAARSSVPATKVVTYDVTSRGEITANMAEFRTQANATLNDGRGWARMGVSFQEVASGGMFTLVMSEASQMPSFSSGCGMEYSCRAGRYVVINQDRWLGATPSWNNAGGSIRDYRHMVINHEIGHWLGHDHATCGGPGQAAPVMQQQSIDLQGCSFNPWPTADELWSTQLGIKKS
jgi:hypothetical protein